jgi:glycosyltransferase involved in cell wall biosynthesis
MRICIVTCGVAATEPRLVKQAVALRQAWPRSKILVADAVPDGAEVSDHEIFRQGTVLRSTRVYPTRRSNLAAWVAHRAWVSASKARWALFQELSPAIFGVRSVSLESTLLRSPADVYIVHGIDALLPVAMAARYHRAKIVFDSMEYYSDMGDNQTNTEATAVRAVQTRVLPICDLILTASEEIADALTREYNIQRPLPVYNTPSIERELPPKNESEFSLYWRNIRIGFGQRGLDDILVALSTLPSEIKLYVQGELPADKGVELRARIAKLGISGRVIVKPPYRPDEAVRQAAPHTVGLCLERHGPANHEFTVSNKIFDYMMGGLAVISANLGGLRRIIDRSGGGVLFEPGDSQSLADVIGRLFKDRDRVRVLGENARAFALAEANNEADMSRFLANFEKAILSKTAV